MTNDHQSRQAGQLPPKVAIGGDGASPSSRDPLSTEEVLTFLRHDTCENHDKCESCKGLRGMAIKEIESRDVEIQKLRSALDDIAKLQEGFAESGRGSIEATGLLYDCRCIAREALKP